MGDEEAGGWIIVRELGRRFVVEILFLSLKVSASFYMSMLASIAVQMQIQIGRGSGIQRYVFGV